VGCAEIAAAISKRIQKGDALEANSNARIERAAAAACVMMRRTTQADAASFTNPQSD
jgi:hypothetical protein